MPRGEIDEAWIEEAVRRYRRIESLQAEFDAAVAGVQVTVRSPDGLVEVVVTAAGTITDVRFLGPLHNRHPRDVANSVQTAVTAAADAAQWAREKLHNETFAAYRPLAGA
ncbi:YbaB/EbfC family nucleoid-associated protein [Micromonospora sp. NPDC050187]|uniref:YbaB/EbfC family nucleoid-associated protein n=1 Tax=Micromonospora sp. NPDC050187 TaxID=3364277 RepID=UPI0037A360F2